MKRLVALLLLYASVCLGQTADAQKAIEQGNAAAHRDDHAAAIKAYQQAIAQDPSVREAVIVKLGLQYLWADLPVEASRLLSEYVNKHPEDCSVTPNYARALAWSNQLRQARSLYQRIQRDCPEIAIDAILGEARTLRWMDRNSTAARVYREAAEKGTASQQQDAQLGLALTKLAQDDNRAARADFNRLMAAAKPDPGAAEGLAVSDLHLGLPDRAAGDLEWAQRLQVDSPQLRELSRHIDKLSAPTIRPVSDFFRDGDGTTYYGGEARGSVALNRRGHAEGFAGSSVLEGAAGSINGHWAGGALEQRFNELIAVRGEGRVTRFSEAEFEPFTGEVDAIITPADRTRADITLGRITIWDNQAALLHHLLGTFASVGLDQRFTPNTGVTLAYDFTRWSEGNQRMRYRFSPSHRFEGIPHFALSLPMLYQSYDQGFRFGLFSPRSYIEITPAGSLQLRKGRIWAFYFGGRIGAQKESQLEWKPLGAFEARVTRDLKKGWSFNAMFAHSSSNVASASGFSRTRVSVSVLRQF